MAIGSNDAIYKFGTQTELTVASPGSVANGAFSAASDVSDWTNSDDAPLASFVLVLQDLSAAPTEGDAIGLYCKPLNIVNTTGDHYGPVIDDCETIYMGSFTVSDLDPAATDDNYMLGPLPLPVVKSSQEFEFYIKNDMTTVSIDAADWELWITPLTVGPGA